MNWIFISFSQLLYGRNLISGNPRLSLLFSLGFHLNSRQAYRPLVLNFLSGLVSVEMPCLPAAGFGRALLYSLCVCVCSVAHYVQLFATSWTVVCQAPLSMGFSRQEYWSGLPFPSPEDLPNQGIEPWSPASQANSLPLELQESPIKYIADSR